MVSKVHSNKELYVSLGSVFDNERFWHFSFNEKLEELAKPQDFIYFPVADFQEASNLCRKYIEFYKIGSSTWVGGRIIDAKSNFVAQISFNGRVWETENYPSKEIKIC